MSRKSFFAFLGLLSLSVFSNFLSLADDGAGDGCLKLAQDYHSGEAEITHRYYTGIPQFGDGIQLVIDDGHFNAGDTIIINITSIATPDINPVGSFFTLFVVETGASITGGVPSTLSYTFTQGIDTNALLYVSLNYLTFPSLGALFHFRVNCVHGIEEQAGSEPPDDRLNWQSGDAHIAILFPSESGINIFLYESQSYISNFISEEDIAVYIDNPPSENSLIRSEGQVSVYILTTGQIQFNLGPDAEGKIYTIIMDDLSGTNMTTSYYDPNE